jgi:hypothetical protein
MGVFEGLVLLKHEVQSLGISRSFTQFTWGRFNHGGLRKDVRCIQDQSQYKALLLRPSLDENIT